MKRRDFLKTGLKIGVAANALPVMLAGLPVRALGRSPLRSALEASGGANNNVLVIIQLQGGNDGLNCVVPWDDSNYASLRKTLGLTLKASSNLNGTQPSDLFQLPAPNDSLAFHWGMRGFSQLFSENKIALIQNVGYPAPSLSHFRGTDIWNSATDSTISASTGWIGRLLLEQNPGFPPQSIPAGSWPLAIQFGNSLSNLFLAQSGGMGIALSSLPTKANSGGHNYDAIPQNPTTQYQELQYVRTIQEETEVYAQTIVSTTLKANKVPYPTSTLATQLSQIAQLVASGASTKIYLVTQGSYDTHANELTNQGSLLTDLAAAVLAFQQDIEQLGVADQVAMMTYSEFGRRPAENGSGTDHGTAAPHFFIGTQVKGGVYGNDPALDATTLKNAAVPGNLNYDPLHDFRNVYATAMNEWLLAGGDQTQITKDIQNVLTRDSVMTYSANSIWQSLGVFKSSQNYVGSSPDAVGLMLGTSYPNPAYGPTTVPYTLDVAGPVEIGIYNTSGVEMERIVDGWQSAGPQRASFDASRLPSGAYLYRLTTSKGSVARPLVVEH